MTVPTELRLPDPPQVPDLRGIDWSALLEQYGLRLLGAVLILIVGVWLARFLSRALERVLTRARVEPTASGFLKNLSYAAMLLIAFVATLAHLGVNTTSLLAVLGTAGLAIGLALKDSLSNIASGVMLIVLRPFRDGDHVVISGMEGVVDEIRVFQTKIKTFDHRIVILPNSTITSTAITNYTVLPTRRIEISVGVGYDDDLKKAQEILLDIANQHSAILKTPSPFVQVSDLGDSAITLQLFAFTTNENFGSTKSDVLISIRDQFKQNAISIPYPQQDIHFYDATPEAGMPTAQNRPLQ